MKKFEYITTFIPYSELQELNDQLKNFGEEGWELCSCDINFDITKNEKIIDVFIFKREIQKK